MILWFAISLNLFFFAFFSTREASRVFKMLLSAWLIVSLGLHMLGGPNVD